jgi:phage terminase small subunit
MPRVKRFVAEYVWGANAGKPLPCALAAGYGAGSKRHASTTAYELSRRPGVRALIAAEQAERERALKDRFLAVAEETYRLATVDIGVLFGEGGALLPLAGMPEDARRAIASIEVEELFEGAGGERTQIGVTRKIKIHDKRAAQDLFLKFAGKLKEQVQVEGLSTLEQLVPLVPRKATDDK